MQQRISIIIPTYMESPSIKAVLLQFESNLPDNVEIILADGSPSEQTVTRAKEASEQWHIPIAVLAHAGGSRAKNMNTGAASATGDILLFLHADSFLPPHWDRQIRKAVDSGVKAGAFEVRFNNPSWIFKLIARYATFRARTFGMYHGNQAIWMTKDVYQTLGGFDDVILMEDVLMSKRLKKNQVVTTLLPGKIITSARRIEAYGWKKSIIRYFVVNTLFRLGVSPKTLYAMYETKRDQDGRTAEE